MAKLEFYGQTGEDYIIWKAFDEKTKGFYVDVGAADGKRFSNSYFFEKQGWDGICVEPNREFFELLKNKRKNSICVNCAVGCYNGTVDFYEKGLNSSVNIDEYIESRKSANRLSGIQTSDYNKVQIQVRTLNDILEENNVTNIDFITIDVEGFELEVLKGFNLAKYRPSVILLEDGFQKEEKCLEMNFILSNFSYNRICKIKNNIFYCNDEVISKKIDKYKSDGDRFVLRKRFKGTKNKK